MRSLVSVALVTSCLALVSAADPTAYCTGKKNPLGCTFSARIDEEDAIRSDRGRDIRAGPDEHPYVVSNRPPVELGRNLVAAPIAATLSPCLGRHPGGEPRERKRQRAAREKLSVTRHGGQFPAIASASLNRYSGYMVSAPSKYSVRGRS